MQLYAALPKLFPTVSRPSTMSTLPCRSLPTDVHASVSLPPRQSKLNENLSIGDAFGKKSIIDQKTNQQIYPQKIVRGLLNPSVVFFCLAEIGKCESKGHGASRNAWHATWHAASRNARRIGWEVTDR